MFLGHFALAFGAKRAAPRVSLGWLVAAAQFSDLLWPVLLLTGTESVRIESQANPFLRLDFIHYPWSHSLLMLAVWGALIAVGYGIWRGDSRGAVVLGLLALSHWGLDWISHRPDLPLVPGGRLRTGLGIWDSAVATVAIESCLFIGGLNFYFGVTRPLDRTGRYALWGLIGFLVLVYLSSLSSAPPPSVRAIGWVGVASWLLPLWAWWADRHRAVVGMDARQASQVPQPGVS